MMVQEHIFGYDVLDGHDLESKYSKKGTSRTRRYRRERQIANEQRQSRFTVHPEHCGGGCPMGPTRPTLFVIFIVENTFIKANPQVQVSLTLFEKTTFMRGTISQKGHLSCPTFGASLTANKKRCLLTSPQGTCSTTQRYILIPWSLIQTDSTDSIPK